MRIKRLDRIKFEELLAFLFFGIGNVSRMFLQFFHIPREAFYVVYFGLFFAFVVKNLKRVKLFDALYYLVITVVAGLGTLRYARYITSKTNVFAIAINFYLAYFFFRFSDMDVVLRGLKNACWFAAFYLLVYYFTVVRHLPKYSINYAYLVAPPISVLAYDFIKRKNPVALALAILLLFTLIISGARGALALTVLCVGYYWFCFSLKKKRSKVWFVGNVALLALVLVVILYFNQICALMIRLFPNSRTLQKILEGEYMVSRPRDFLYNKVQTLIRANPRGYGPLASRKLIDYYPYPHSLLYELQLDFGVPSGFALFAIIMLMVLSNFLKYSKGESRLLIGFISVIGMGSLMVSSSYYYEIYVPATIALYVNGLRSRRAMSPADLIKLLRRERE